MFTGMFKKEKSALDAADMTPQMMMTMMNTMCMMMMRDMMDTSTREQGPKGGRGPGMGMGPMGRPNPMKMMRKMMGGSFGKADAEKTREKTETAEAAHDHGTTG
jgi:hypothetical protein